MDTRQLQFSTVSVPHPSDGTVYAVALGGTHIRYGFLDESDVTRFVDMCTLPSATGDRATDRFRLIQKIVQVLEEVAAVAPPMVALAIAAPGWTELRPHPMARNYGPLRDADLCITSVNIPGLRDVALQARLEDLGWNIPIHVENDTNAALRGINGFDDSVGLTLGTGCAAGIKICGRIQRAEGSWGALEIGHGLRTLLTPELMRLCRCGQTGCVEAIVGGWALEEQFGVSVLDAGPDVANEMADLIVDALADLMAATLDQFSIPDLLLTGSVAENLARRTPLLSKLRKRVEGARNDNASTGVHLMDSVEMPVLRGAILAARDAGVSAPAAARN